MPKTRPLLLMLDYDGTLTPLLAQVDKSYLAPRTRRLLARLALRIRVIIVTGRDIRDLTRLAGPLSGVGRVGTHGVETRGIPGFSLSTSLQRARLVRDRKRLMRAFHREFDGEPGLFLQEKRYALSLHYASLKPGPRKERILRRRFRRVVRLHGAGGLWTFQAGRDMIDLRPRGFSKAKAVGCLMKRFHEYQIIFAGDDRSDWGALARLGKKGLKIAVGPHVPARLCDRRFASPKAFCKWLETLASSNKPQKISRR